ncbi:MAG: hypothetical protein Q7T13_07230 [Polaromonas sp.]|nr:hypothetical protein [Polaromonas sp.]
MNKAQQLIDPVEAWHSAYDQYTTVEQLAEGQVFMPPASRIAPRQKFHAWRNAWLSTLADRIDGIKRHHRQQTEEPNADPS